MKSDTTLILRSLTMNDVEAAIALDQAGLSGLWTQAGYQREIQREQGISLGIMDSSAGLIGMGFAWLVLDEAHIVSIAVDPDWQGYGLGSLLLNQIIRQAAQKDCRQATLEVNQANRAAIALYQKYDFRELGVRTDYYGKGKHALIFWLSQIQSQAYQGFLTQSFHQQQSQLRQIRVSLNVDAGLFI